MAANALRVTELDFDSIKSNMKAYFTRQNSPFRDWDFEGSGLSYLLDVLAYNTHYNAVNAHLSMNESFLDSAQIRSNVVSRARLLGYTPRSRRGARAELSLTFTRNSNATDVKTLTLPRGSLFSTQIDGNRYVFSTRQDYEAIYNSQTGLFSFPNVTIVQGLPKVETFVVNGGLAHQVFNISDINIDTSSLEVRVKSHSQSSEATTYLNADTRSTYDETSAVYFLSENYEGSYQLEFGDGLIGRSPENLNVVEISYLSSAGSEANGARNISFVRPSTSVFTSTATLKKIIVLETAYGGDERESIDAIRTVAPRAFIAQNRVVTAKDYEAMIKKNIPDVEAISVWGGQENDPPVYGKVFLAAKPKGALFLSDAQKEEILNYLRTVSMVTVFPEIVDTSYIYLSFDVFFKYNPTLTTLTASQLASKVRSTISDFSENGLGGFDNIFRYSKFLNAIDTTDESILNSFARIYVRKLLPLYAADNSAQEVDFRMPFYGQIDQVDSYITSSSWRYNNQTVYLADEYRSGNSSERNLFIYTVIANGKRVKVIPSIGTLNVSTGRIAMDRVPTTFDTTISITAIPNAYDVATIRNQLITIDLEATSITGDTDATFDAGAADRIYDTIPRFRS